MFKLYNGCPNDELQAHWDAEDKAESFIREAGYRITYFIMEGGYHLCDAESYKPIGDLFSSKQAAASWLKDYKEQNDCEVKGG